MFQLCTTKETQQRNVIDNLQASSHDPRPAQRASAGQPARDALRKQA
jgi:hypothetical protein